MCRGSGRPQEDGDGLPSPNARGRTGRIGGLGVRDDHDAVARVVEVVERLGLHPCRDGVYRGPLDPGLEVGWAVDAVRVAQGELCAEPGGAPLADVDATADETD